MIKKVTQKSKYLQLVLGLMFIFLVLPAKQGWTEPSSKLGQEASKIKHDVSKLRDKAIEKLKGEHHPVDDDEEGAANSVDVIVSDTPPLSIPKEFKDAVASLGGKFIIIGDGKTVRLLSLDGIYFNPCFSEASGKMMDNSFDKGTHTCKFSSGLSQTNMLLAQKFGGGGGGGGGNICRTCNGADGATDCNKNTDKYPCHGTPKHSCSNDC